MVVARSCGQSGIRARGSHGRRGNAGTGPRRRGSRRIRPPVSKGEIRDGPGMTERERLAVNMQRLEWLADATLGPTHLPRPPGPPAVPSGTRHSVPLDCAAAVSCCARPESAHPHDTVDIGLPAPSKQRLPDYRIASEYLMPEFAKNMKENVMSEHIFDTLTRSTAAATSRRGYARALVASPCLGSGAPRFLSMMSRLRRRAGRGRRSATEQEE